LDLQENTLTAYHPQTDGKTERVNQEVEQFLQLFMDQRQDDWYNWLAIAKFAYNDWVHASMNSSPFMLDTRQKPQLGIKPRESNALRPSITSPIRWKQQPKKHIQPSPKH